MDNASYHSSSYAPLVKSRKAVIIEFLLAHTDKLGEDFGPNPNERIKKMKLKELRPLLSKMKKEHGFYKINEIS